MQFGVARCDITPPFRMPMYGYGSRRDVFDDVHDPLHCAVVVLADGDRRACLIAADIGSFPNDGRSLELMRRVGEAVGCPAENVMLNASHTHGGPLVPMGEGLLHREISSLPAVRRYEEFLFEQISTAAVRAASELRPGRLRLVEGRTTLPMNRRPTRNGRVPNAPNPEGPVDSRLFCFFLSDTSGRPVAVGIRVSCHPVATGAQHRITADFPGAWKRECRRAFGDDVIPFFLQGAGADARPRHVAAGDRWRVMPHAELENIGRDLMAEMLAALVNDSGREITSLLLEGRFEEVPLPCERRYTTKDDFLPLLDRGGVMARYAQACLERLEKGGEISDHAIFHVQTLRLDEGLTLVGIDGEVLCGTGSVVEQACAPAAGIVLGYTNGVIAYLPDEKEMARGGYETESYLYNLWSGPLLPGIEHRLAAAVRRE